MTTRIGSSSMGYLADRGYDTCAPDGSCGCYDDVTSSDYPEPLDLEDASVEPMASWELELLEGVN